MGAQNKALIVVWRSLGHLNASLGVAKRLIRLGFDVAYLGPSEIRDRVLQQGFFYHQCDAFEGLPLPVGVGKRVEDLLVNTLKPRLLNTLLTSWRSETKGMLHTIAARAELFRKCISEINPGLIIFDPFMLYFYIPLYDLNIATAALSTKSLATRSRDVPPYTKSTVPSETCVSRLLINIQWFSQFLQYQVWDLYQRILFGASPKSICEQLAKDYRFPMEREWATRPFATDLRFRSVPEWVLYCPAFDFPRDSVMSNGAHYIGACIDLDRVEAAVDFGIDANYPLIVCILTSVYKPNSAASKRRDHFIKELFKCMEAHPEYRMILSSGRGSSMKNTQAYPPNVILREHIPVLSILDRADLLITQGGGNIVKEGISHEVNLLTFPDAADQPGLAARLEYHGLSRVRPLRLVRAREIFDLIRDSLRDCEQRHRIKQMKVAFVQFETNDIPLRKAVDSARTQRIDLRGRRFLRW